MRNLQEKPFYGVIKEFEYWVVLFRDKQVTIGSVIIMSKELDKNSLGDVTPEAWSEFGVVSTFVETTITKAFGAEKFNYLALMMYDPEVHFHVIPRYSKPVNFAGREFIDPDWPSATKKVALELDQATLDAIKEKLLSANQ
ncbi:HIT family protein [Candidatus Saccharibacteria bacterium]|nr:HIT family protein [Candidatus Saccharibacteria bacterium]